MGVAAAVLVLAALVSVPLALSVQTTSVAASSAKSATASTALSNAGQAQSGHQAGASAAEGYLGPWGDNRELGRDEFPRRIAVAGGGRSRRQVRHSERPRSRSLPEFDTRARPERRANSALPAISDARCRALQGLPPLGPITFKGLRAWSMSGPAQGWVIDGRRSTIRQSSVSGAQTAPGPRHHLPVNQCPWTRCLEPSALDPVPRRPVPRSRPPEPYQKVAVHLQQFAPD